MKRTIVSLVSDQTQPNVLMIREFSVNKKMDFDRYIFVTTDKMEEKRKTELITNVCNIPRDRIEKISVPMDSMEDTIERLSGLKYDDDEEFIVNITCGTKMMSIGVYLFFHERSSEIYYIPVNENVLKKIHPRGSDGGTEIMYRMDLREYLESHGIKMKNLDKKNVSVCDFSIAEKMLAGFLNDKFDYDVFRKLRGKRDEKKGVPLDSVRNLKIMLEKIGYPLSDAASLSRDEVRYLTGGWFEEYAYWLLKTHGKIEDRNIGLNLEMKNNEFDVMFTHENRLFMVECKTGLSSRYLKPEVEYLFMEVVRSIKKENKINEEDFNELRNIDLDKIFKSKDIVSETIYKSSALQRDFGLSVQSYLFALDKKLTNGNGKKDQNYSNRAKNFNVKIIPRPVFENDGEMKKKLEEIFKRPV